MPGGDSGADGGVLEDSEGEFYAGEYHDEGGRGGVL